MSAGMSGQLVGYCGETDRDYTVEIEHDDVADCFAIFVTARGTDLVNQIVVDRDVATHIAAGLVTLLAAR